MFMLPKEGLYNILDLKLAPVFQLETISFRILNKVSIPRHCMETKRHRLNIETQKFDITQ